MTTVPAYVRARGGIRAVFRARDGRTHAESVFETGGLRLRFPKTARGCEGVIVNTGGGVAGGDQADYDFTAGAESDVVLTTVAAEKIYRAERDAAEISLSLRAGERSTLAWLPQETILFSGARLRRRLDADMAADASLTIVEALVFGRMAMGELVVEGELHDRWRVRRGRKLIFAEDLRIDGDITGTLDRPAAGRKGRATATILHVSPGAEGRLEDVRAVLAHAPCEWGASAWNGMLAARFISPSPEMQRAAIVLALQALRGCAPPRVWS